MFNDESVHRQNNELIWIKISWLISIKIDKSFWCVRYARGPGVEWIIILQIGNLHNSLSATEQSRIGKNCPIDQSHSLSDRMAAIQMRPSLSIQLSPIALTSLVLNVHVIPSQQKPSSIVVFVRESIILAVGSFPVSTFFCFDSVRFPFDSPRFLLAHSPRQATRQSWLKTVACFHESSTRFFKKEFSFYFVFFCSPDFSTIEDLSKYKTMATFNDVSFLPRFAETTLQRLRLLQLCRNGLQGEISAYCTNCNMTNKLIRQQISMKGFACFPKCKLVLPRIRLIERTTTSFHRPVAFSNWFFSRFSSFENSNRIGIFTSASLS